MLESKKDTSLKPNEDAGKEFHSATGQSVDASLDEVLQAMKKFEDDLMKNLGSNHNVDQNKYKQLLAKWTDLVKTKFSSPAQIKEEMEKCADNDPDKYYKLEPIWRDVSHQEYLASLST